MVAKPGTMQAALAHAGSLGGGATAHGSHLESACISEDHEHLLELCLTRLHAEPAFCPSVALRLAHLQFHAVTTAPAV